MAYHAEISRSNPACILFLIDQSGSMADPWSGGREKNKSDELALIINRLLRELCISSARAEGVRDYFNVGVIGYGSQVGPAFSGPLAGREMVPISEVALSPDRVEDIIKKTEDGAGGIVDQTIRLPIWFDPVSSGGTPMCQALGHAYSITERWLAKNQNSFPPIVINITDGESTDGDPVAAASRIRELANNDGNVLLFNIHISAQGGEPEMFPDDEQQLRDEFARTLFLMSSPLPESMIAQARREGFKVSGSSRGFVFNSDIIGVIRFLEIGTKPSNLR
ncbi:MAG: VWA domain-containing protein [Firmicutes bacterium]|nr:VWA domain-containing protein [Bacillota bacterium]